MALRPIRPEGSATSTAERVNPRQNRLEIEGCARPLLPYTCRAQEFRAKRTLWEDISFEDSQKGGTLK